MSGSPKIPTFIRQKMPMCVCVGRGVYLAQVVKKIVNVVCEPKYELFILKKWWKYTIQAGLNVKCLFRIYYSPLCTSTATFSFSLLYFI